MTDKNNMAFNFKKGDPFRRGGILEFVIEATNNGEDSVEEGSILYTGRYPKNFRTVVRCRRGQIEEFHYSVRSGEPHLDFVGTFHEGTNHYEELNKFLQSIGK